MTSSTARAHTSRRRLVTVQPEPRPNRAIFIDASSRVAVLWGRAYALTTAVEELAAREFAATAIAAMDTLAEVPHGAVEVIGDGILAALTRQILTDRAPTVGPSAIVETSGSPAAVRDALRRSDPLGTVLLTAPPTHASVELATYSDLHVRGALVVGIPWHGNPTDHHTSPELVAMALDQLVDVTLGTPLPRAPWYRLVA